MKVKSPHKIILMAFVLILLMGTICFANYYVGGRSSGGIFNAYYDSSVSSYGYSPHYDVGRTNWGGISTKVSVSKTTSTSNYPDKYYVGISPITDDLGLTIPYEKNGLGVIVQSSFADSWLYCNVVIYHNSFVANNMTAAQIKSTVTHEIGHTLSLAHPYPASTPSVMRQAIQSIGPNTYDKTDLKSRWGN